LLAIVVNAQSAGSSIKRGNELFAREQYKLALDQYRKIRPNDGASYAQALYNIGVCHFELWETDDAIAYYKLAITARPGGYAKASYALGIALESQSRWHEAKLAYEQALSGDSEGAALFKLGVLAARQGEQQAAMKLFREAIALVGPHVPSSHNNLG